MNIVTVNATKTLIIWRGLEIYGYNLGDCLRKVTSIAKIKWATK